MCSFQLRPLRSREDTTVPFYTQAWLRQHPEIRLTHMSIGHHADTGDEYMIPDRDRTMSMHIAGNAGWGKSSLMKNLIHQAAEKGEAIFVFDSHGDAADEVVAEEPQARVADTFVLDMLDESHPFGINIFDEAGKITSDAELTQTVDRICHVFTLLWPEIEKQLYAKMLLRYAVIAFLSYPGATLPDMIDFFNDDDFRAKVLAKTKDRSVRKYFADEYDSKDKSERTRRISPLMSRLYTLFVGRSLPRNILGQRANAINFRRAIEERQIIIIKLPKNILGDDAVLMAAFILAEISAATFSFSDTPPDKRPGVSVFADEFQTYASDDFKRLVQEGRKYGMRLVVAHQDLGQLTPHLQAAVGGVHTTVVFRANTNDVQKLAAIFPARPQAGASGDFDPHPTKYLLEQGASDSLVKTFIEVYLRPLQHHKRSGAVEILSERHIGVLDIIMPGAVGSDGKKAAVEERDPTLYLDNLLVEVMRTKNPMLDIPYEAVAGFANCNGGFYKAVKWARGSQALTGNVQFPEYLANQTHQGYVWLRPPHDEGERFLHFIFHMRTVMMYFARNPLIKGGKVQMVDYAQILLGLPKRMALVRSGDDVGLIQTNDTPRPLVGEALEARRFFIREHTRQRYCHPRDQIETLIENTTPPDEFTLRRWEEVESDDGTSNQTANQSNPTDHSDLRHSAAGNTTSQSGPLSATTADSGATHEITLQPRLDQNGQSPAEDPYDLWVRTIRRDPQP